MKILSLKTIILTFLVLTLPIEALSSQNIAFTNGESNTMNISSDVIFEKASDELINSYMREIDTLIDEIVYSPTNLEFSGTKYYISSSDGDNSNTGLSPDDALKTLDSIDFLSLMPGDAVLLKRGDSWRITEAMLAKEGITISAYGTGAKPRIICSVDASEPDLWYPTDYPNIYAYNEKLPAYRDVGGIIFDSGDAWGIKVVKNSNGTRVDNQDVFNGLMWQRVDQMEFTDHRDLRADLEFYHDLSNETLYVYSENKSPAERFSSIELMDKGAGIKGDSYCNVTIDNIEIYGTGSFAISFYQTSGLTVQYCVFKWIGGSLQYHDQDSNIRYGNAVECCALDNYTVHHCYSTQIYDCCYTSQSAKEIISNNCVAYKNVAEFCNSGLEYWNESRSGNAGFSNMSLHDNYTRYAGYGWSHQRPYKVGNFFYGSTNTTLKFENNSVHSNVNLFASKYALKVAAVAPTQYNFNNNVYVMEEGKYLGYTVSNPGLGTGSIAELPYDYDTILKAVNEGFESGGKFYYTDSSPLGDMYDLYVPEKPTPVFPDITDGFWGKSYINYVLDKEYMSGISDFEFAPNGSLTRSMATALLMNLAKGSPIEDEIPYIDVNSDAWYYDSIVWALENEIIDSGKRFRPDEAITREELAHMLYKFSGKNAKNTEMGFNDVGDITPSYRVAVDFCVANGIINGYEDNTLKPHNPITRAEAAAIIFRFNQNI